MSKIVNARLDKKNPQELINLLDIALSSHHMMKDKDDGLEAAQGDLSEKNYELMGKIHDEYTDWKDQARKEGKKWAKNFGRVVSKNIRNLGVQKGLMQVCGDNPTREQKKYEKHLQALEDDFVKQNKKKIVEFNIKYYEAQYSLIVTMESELFKYLG